MKQVKPTDWLAKSTAAIKAKLPFLNVSLKIQNTPRKALSVFLALGLVISVVGLLWNYTASPEEEVENTAYFYQQEAVLNYRVYTVPNELFPERVLGSGSAYITSLTDYIAVDFDYSFFGESEAAISGQYSATASLLAHTAQQEYLVWEKKYQLLPEQHFNSSDNILQLNERIDIPFAEYQAFIDRVREETGYTPAELSLVFSCNLNMRAETPDGVINETLTPMMIIPMKGNTFTVGGDLVVENEGGITQVDTVAPSPVDGRSVPFSMLAAFSAVALLFLRLFTVSVAVKEKPGEQKVTAILKKHKERIVLTTNGLASIPKGAVVVISFEELLKLADEVGKPILYPQPKPGSSNDHYFLIYTQEKVYAYGVSETPISM